MENKKQNGNKFEKIGDKKKEESSNDENKFKYIYFIITYNKSKKLIVNLSPEYKEFDSLEKLDNKSFQEEKDFLYSDVYRFKIIEEAIYLLEDQKEFPIPINVENENKKYQYIIKLKDLKRDFYEYNFEIEELDVLPLNYQNQFEIYLDILRNKFQKEQNTSENEDFILSTQLLLAGEDKNYNFLFYLSILIECFNTQLIKKHLLTFKTEKIIELGEVNNKKLNQIKNILNLLIEKPEKILIENEENRQKLIELFYSVVFYFNLHFQKEKVKDLFENEQYSESLYEKLIKIGNYYKGLILPKKIVVKLIKKTDDYNQVLNILFYLGNDAIQFLEFINEENNYITNLFQKEKIKIEKENIQKKDKKKKKEISLIDIEKYIQPKKEDDIMKLNILINELINYQKEYGISYIKITYSFFEKYINYNNIANFDNFGNIGLIKNIIENYKIFDKSFEYKDNLNELIHVNGMHLIKKGLLKNINLLEFIKKDIYFHDKKYESKRSIDILNGIDISSLEKNFFKKWKNINFNIIFRNNFINFMRKIALLIKEMKDFGLLFSFYSFYQEDEYNYESISYMQKRFIEIINTYSNKKCPNFIDDVDKLIYWSDKKNVNLNKFLKEDIQRLLNSEKVIEIYIKLIDEHQDLSKNIKGIIIDFLSINNNENPSFLLFLIKNSKKLSNDIFSKINKLIIKEEDFFKSEENERLKFFKGLIKEKLIKKSNLEEKTIYISKSHIVISDLKIKIQNYDITFNTLSSFFPDEKNDKLEGILKDRLN